MLPTLLNSGGTKRTQAENRSSGVSDVQEELQRQKSQRVTAVQQQWDVPMQFLLAAGVTRSAQETSDGSSTSVQSSKGSEDLSSQNSDCSEDETFKTEKRSKARSTSRSSRSYVGQKKVSYMSSDQQIALAKNVIDSTAEYFNGKLDKPCEHSKSFEHAVYICRLLNLTWKVIAEPFGFDSAYLSKCSITFAKKCDDDRTTRESVEKLRQHLIQKEVVMPDTPMNHAKTTKSSVKERHTVRSSPPTPKKVSKAPAEKQIALAEQVIAATAKYFGVVDKEEMLSKRSNSFEHAAYISRLLELNWHVVDKSFKSNHQQLCRHTQKFARQCDANPTLRESVDKLCQYLIQEKIVRSDLLTNHAKRSLSSTPPLQGKGSGAAADAETEEAPTIRRTNDPKPSYLEPKKVSTIAEEQQIELANRVIEATAEYFTITKEYMLSERLTAFDHAVYMCRLLGLMWIVINKPFQSSKFTLSRCSTRFAKECENDQNLQKTVARLRQHLISKGISVPVKRTLVNHGPKLLQTPL